MADEKKVVAPAEEAVKEEAPKKAAPKKKEAKKEEPKAPTFAKAIAHDYEVVLEPVITEKAMALMQNENKVTIKVAASANKIEIKESFQRIFQVPVDDVKISNVRAKSTTRGGRYRGTISGFKKAVVTVRAGSAIDLFKE